jgi:cell division protein FtsZ
MAISSPLLEASIDGAHGVLLSIQGGSDLGLFEINESAQLVANSAAPEANIIFGAVIDDALGDEVRVTVIAAGFGEANNSRSQPARLSTAQAAGTSGVAFYPSPFPAASEPVAGHGEVAGPLAEGATVSAAAAGDAGTADPYGAVTAGTDAGTGAPYGAVTAGRAMAAAAASRQADANGAASPRAGASNGGPPPRAADADGGAPPRAAQEPARPRPDTASAARVFDAATTTRRRSVVFEEDDELDVPDFLK